MNATFKKYNNFLLLLENPKNLEIQIIKYFEEEYNELFEEILMLNFLQKIIIQVKQ